MIHVTYLPFYYSHSDTQVAPHIVEKEWHRRIRHNLLRNSVQLSEAPPSCKRDSKRLAPGITRLYCTLAKEQNFILD
jgi:hypothetical protein